jgi:hypothetical protein
VAPRADLPFKLGPRKPCADMADTTREWPFAGVAELVDARDLGSRDVSRGGSSPSARTMHQDLSAVEKERSCK